MFGRKNNEKNNELHRSEMKRLKSNYEEIYKEHKEASGRFYKELASIKKSATCCWTSISDCLIT